MTGGFVYAGDLARDLGFDGMTPAFWDWCRKNRIESTEKGPFAFDPDKVRDVVRDLRASGQLPGQRWGKR